MSNGHPIQGIYQQIREVLIRVRGCGFRAVNTEMVACYWQIGRLIVEEDQRGEKRAAYGEGLIKEFSGRRVKVSEGFSRIGYNFQ